MYSPQDRIYTTPDVSVASVNAIMQHLKLERLLRKVGKCHNTQSIPMSCPTHAARMPAMPIIQPTCKQTIRPFEKYDGNKPHKSSNSNTKPQPAVERKPVFIPLQTIRTLGNARSGTHGVPILDLIQKNRAQKNEALRAAQDASNAPVPEIYKPFSPQKSPRRLPAIKRDKDKDPPHNMPNMHIKPNEKMSYFELANQEFIANSKAEKRRAIVQLSQEQKKRKMRTQREMEFREWQDTQNDSKKLHTFELKCDQEIMASQERFHEIADNTKEEMYRNKISTNIKQGIQKKLDSFRDNDTLTNRVYNLTFGEGTKPPVKKKR